METYNPLIEKKYYKYNDIDKMLNRILYANNTYFVLQSRLKDVLMENQKYLNCLKICSSKRNLPDIPNELWFYIIELKYNLNNYDDLGTILLFNEMVVSDTTSSESPSLFCFHLYQYHQIYLYNEHNNFYFDLGFKIIGLHYLLKLCIDIRKNKYFFRVYGMDFDDCLEIEELKDHPDYDKYLFSFNEIADKACKIYLNCCMNTDVKYTFQKDVLQLNV